MAHHRDPQGNLELRANTGEWVLIVERKTADGGTSAECNAVNPDEATCCGADGICGGGGSNAMGAFGAFLDDHAAMLDAGLELQRAGAGHAHFETALATAHAIRDRFFDADLGDFFLSACDGEPLAHRPRSDHDGATPHASGLAVLGLLRAGTLAGDDSLLEVAQSVLRAWAGHVARQPAAFPTLLRAVAVLERGLCIAVVVGEAEDPAREALLTRARRVLGPEDLVLAVAPGETPPGIAASFLEGRDLKGGRAAAYLCRGNECSLAATTPDELEARC